MSLLEDFLARDGFELSRLTLERRDDVDDEFLQYFLAHHAELPPFHWRVAVDFLAERDLPEVRAIVLPQLESPDVSVRVTARGYMAEQQDRGFIDASWRAALERQRHTA